MLGESIPEHRRAAPNSPKLVWLDRPGPGRVQYGDLIEAVNGCSTTPWDLNIIANSDVFFDDALDVLKPLDLLGVCVALSRWEWKNGRAETLAGDNSQDCWVFQGPVRPLADGTDWRLERTLRLALSWVLRHNDYTLLNLPHDIRHYHLHDSPYRRNGSMTAAPHVQHLPYRRLDDCRISERPLGSGPAAGV